MKSDNQENNIFKIKEMQQFLQKWNINFDNEILNIEDDDTKEFDKLWNFYLELKEDLVAIDNKISKFKSDERNHVLNFDEIKKDSIVATVDMKTFIKGSNVFIAENEYAGKNYPPSCYTIEDGIRHHITPDMIDEKNFKKLTVTDVNRDNTKFKLNNGWWYTQEMIDYVIKY